MPCVDPEMKNALAIQRNTAAITALTQSFQKITTDFDALTADVKKLNDSLDDIVLKGFEDLFDKRMEEEASERKAGDEALKATCATLSETKADKKSLEDEIQSRKDANLVLEEKIKAQDGLAARLVDAESSERKCEDAKLDERLTALEGGSGTITEQIATERKERETKDSELDERLTALEGGSGTITEQIATERKERETKDSELESKIASTNSELKEELTKKDAELESAIAKCATTDELKSVNEAHANLVSYVDGLEKRIAVTEGMSSSVEGINADIVEVKRQLAENSQLISDLSARETKDYNSLSTRISNLEKTINDFIR